MADKFKGDRLYKVRAFSKGSDSDSKGIVLAKDALEIFPQIEKTLWKVTITSKEIIFKSGCLIESNEKL